ncbi:ricin-type beta-trefoil lectin domain protein, partial [Streptomyces sp. NPDC048425]
MARLTRRRFIAIAAATAAAAGTQISAAPLVTAATAATVTVTPDPSYLHDRFEGWGTSLVWFANATGHYPDEIRERIAELVFGRDGLA